MSSASVSDASNDVAKVVVDAFADSLYLPAALAFTTAIVDVLG